MSYLGWKAAGLPFAPFDIFDWAVRLLPGGFVTVAIESTVAIGRAAGVASISAAAKTGDQVLAIAGLLGAGTLAGAALFALLSLADESASLLGGILGAILGGLALIAELRLARLPPGTFVPGAWVFATCVGWGAAVGWTYDRLATARGAEDAGVRRFRRQFLLTLGGLTAASTLAGALFARLKRSAGGRRWSDEHALPDAGSGVTPVAGTRAEFTAVEDFYRIDTDTRAPAIDDARWRLAVTGLVDRPQTLTLADVRAFEPADVFATLSCISNPPGGDLISTTRWTGVSLQRVLPRLGLAASATHLKVTSADGFFEVVALDTIRADARAMLVYAWDGVPLPAEHGFPLRLYVPDLYGMKQPKWVTGLEALSRWEPGYWVARGWDREGHVVPAAAVDAVVRRGDLAEVGGIAYAGSRGVAKVDVRGSDGEWHEAQLRLPLSDLTWVVWRAELRASGPYVARVVSSRA